MRSTSASRRTTRRDAQHIPPRRDAAPWRSASPTTTWTGSADTPSDQQRRNQLQFGDRTESCQVLNKPSGKAKAHERGRYHLQLHAQQLVGGVVGARAAFGEEPGSRGDWGDAFANKTGTQVASLGPSQSADKLSESRAHQTKHLFSSALSGSQDVSTEDCADSGELYADRTGSRGD